MKGRRLSEYEEERDDEIHNMRVQQLVNRFKYATKAILVFTIFCLCLALYRHLITKDYIEDGKLYRNIHEFSIKNSSSYSQKQKEGSLVVNNQQLEHFSWTILQLSTAQFPQEFGSEIIDRFNIFLRLFGEFYPCKKCREFYFQELQRSGPFVGKTRKQGITFVCQFHNRINTNMGKKTIDCSQAQQEWAKIH